MSIFQYRVKLDDCHPMYGTTKLLADFKGNKEGAIAYAKQYARTHNTGNWNVVVIEYEYTSEHNLQIGFDLCSHCVWSAAFHGIDD